MRHTVIGLFDTYTQAENARDTLVQTGFASASIELQENQEPAVVAGEAVPTGLLGNIERFLSSLFASGPRPEETTRYTEAMRRGAVLLRVDAASESHAELASNTLTRLGAIEVHQQAGSWGPGAQEADVGTAREHSVLDELGIGAGGSMPRTPSPVAPDPYRTDDASRDTARPDDPLTGTSTSIDPITEPLVGSALMGDPLTRTTPLPDPLDPRGAPMHASDPGALLRPGEPVPDAAVPDEFLEYEEDFRNHYDERYGSENARYEDYESAYRYGAMIGRDARYRDMPWNDVEPEARRDWEKTTSSGASLTWERITAAVRHGWDRVTGHHHHPQ